MKSCPIKRISLADTDCDQEECGFWVPEWATGYQEGVCAAVVIALNLFNKGGKSEADQI